MTDSIHAALFEIRKALNYRVHKGAKANAGQYSYQFADYPSLIELVAPLLEAHNILHLAYGDGDKLVVELYHIPSGTAVKSVRGFSIVHNRMTGYNKNGDVVLEGIDFQHVGKNDTYFYRTMLINLLGLAADKDDDGESTYKSRYEDTTPASKPASAPPTRQRLR
jgi:ERF superfamily